MNREILKIPYHKISHHITQTFFIQTFFLSKKCQGKEKSKYASHLFIWQKWYTRVIPKATTITTNHFYQITASSIKETQRSSLEPFQTSTMEYVFKSS